MSKNKKVVCRVRLKDGVLDPQGVTIKHALEQLGFADVLDVRSGKVFELTFKDTANGNLKAMTEEICRKVLANPVIEEFEVGEV
ncbi:MAG: phosphoribosylformylglycinamidine synthase subunit PurS [candidate division Zixibacteria bacterium]|nr:phosphoribosylformylglycinamidine synthase subunit PurS [candidate division Zixibacteria bacterium]